MAQLSGKVCIVTGSSAGIGETVAITFASRGASVVVCGRDTTRLKAVLEKCIKVSGGQSKRFLALSGDLNKGTCRQEIINKTIAKFGRLDVLVANAGILIANGTLKDANEEIFDRFIDSNVKSVFFLIQAAVPHLEKTKGNIVAVSSISGSLPSSPHVIYSVSKAAIDQMVQCLVLDLSPKGIRINIVSPSFTPTKILRELGPNDGEGVAQAVEAQQGALNPLSPRCVTKEELAETVAFLASDAAGFVTGQNIRVDGGRSQAGPFILG